MRLNSVVEDASVIRKCLHHQGKRRKLGGTVVDLQPEQVFGQD
jgi:hypothetical protein